MAAVVVVVVLWLCGCVVFSADEVKPSGGARFGFGLSRTGRTAGYLAGKRSREQVKEEEEEVKGVRTR